MHTNTSVHLASDKQIHRNINIEKSHNVKSRTAKKAMKQLLKDNLNLSAGENLYVIRRGFLHDDSVIGYGVVFGDLSNAVNFMFESQEGELFDTIYMAEAPNKKSIKDFLKKELDCDNGEGLYVVKTSYTIDGELRVERGFIGDCRCYELRPFKYEEEDSAHEACNHFVATETSEVA